MHVPIGENGNGLAFQVAKTSDGRRHQRPVAHRHVAQADWTYLQQLGGDNSRRGIGGDFDPDHFGSAAQAVDAPHAGQAKRGVACGRDRNRLRILPLGAAAKGQACRCVLVPAVIGQSAVDEERVFSVLIVTRCHALDVTLGHAIDRASHEQIERVHLAFGDRADRLDEAVRVVLMPSQKLLFRKEGHAQQSPIVTRRPYQAIRDLLVGPVNQRVPTEEVRRKLGQVIACEPVSLEGVSQRGDRVVALLDVDG